MERIIVADSGNIYTIPSLATAEGMKALVILKHQKPYVKFVLLPQSRNSNFDNGTRRLISLEHYWSEQGAETVKIWSELEDKLSLDTLYDLTPRFYHDIPNIKQGGVIKEVATMIVDKQKNRGTELCISLNAASGLMKEIQDCYKKLTFIESAVKN